MNLPKTQAAILMNQLGGEYTIEQRKRAAARLAADLEKHMKREITMRLRGVEVTCLCKYEGGAGEEELTDYTIHVDGHYVGLNLTDEETREIEQRLREELADVRVTRISMPDADFERSIAAIEADRWDGQD